MILPSLTCCDSWPSPILVLLVIVCSLCPTIHTLESDSNLSTSLHRSLGINCRGSVLCPTFLETDPLDYIGTLIKITNGSAAYCRPDFFCGPLNDTDVYLPGDHIVCLPLGRSFLGGICAFSQGKTVPATGVVGALIKGKLQELSGHGCHVCGSVPLSDDNDPYSRGILTVNYVGGVVCKGLCPSKHYHVLLQSGANGSRFPVDGSYLLKS